MENESSPWMYATGGDSQETIDNCLNCKKPFCNNCVESKGRSKNKSVRADRYCDDELELLKDTRYSSMELANALNRSLRSVQDKRNSLGVKVEAAPKRREKTKYGWNEEIDNYIMSHMPKEGEAKYGIPAVAIARRRHLLSLRMA